MRKKKALRAAAAVAMTGCLMQATCLTINPTGLRNFTNDLFGSVETAVTDGIANVGIGDIISDLIGDAINDALN